MAFLPIAVAVSSRHTAVAAIAAQVSVVAGTHQVVDIYAAVGRAFAGQMVRGW
jgi:hypothetical protein